MSLMGWIGRRPWASTLIVIASVILAFFFTVVLQTPRLDRDWVENLATMPKVDVRDGRFALNPVMNWSYTKEGPADKATTTFAADISDLRNVWFMVEPQPGQPYAAHTLVLFQFGGGRVVGLTIEARLEKGEDYDAINGIFNTYELAYIWATPKDLLTRRVMYLGKQIYIYPLKLSEDQKQAFLKGVIERTQAVETHAEFYNTFTSNCTNELAKIAKLDWHYSWILTGYSPQRLFETHYIPGRDFETAHNLALMTENIRAWNGLSSDDFNSALVEELEKRNAELQNGS